MTDETALGRGTQGSPAGLHTISPAERDILRRLAGRVAELAARPLEQEKRELWYRHNALQPARPLVFCDPENGWNEIIPPDSLACRGKLARQWEMDLRKEVFWGEEMGDDRVIEPFFNVRHVYEERGWGLHETRSGGEDGGAYTWDAPLKDYHHDLSRLHYPQILIDTEASERLLHLAQETLGDLLTARQRTSWWWTLGLTQTAIFLRGLEQLMLDMHDHPSELHRFMAFLRDGHMAQLDWLEKNDLLSPNNDGTYVGSGGFGWSHELSSAGPGEAARTRDMWGFAESQETVGVSPDMFAEFVLQYQLPLLERFGLNCYGCCEPLDQRWRHVQCIPRLRRVSVSPWSSLPRMAELLGDRYILSWKPRPSDLALPAFDEERIRADLREGLRATRGCIVEVIMKDNHTIRNDPWRVTRWVQIAREEAESR